MLFRSSKGNFSKNACEAAEIKCPSPQVHIGYMCEGLGEKYRAQVQGQLMIGGFAAVHFWAYHPQLPPVHIFTVPDDRYINQLGNLLHLFNQEIDAAERFVRKKIAEWKRGDDDPIEEMLRSAGEGG